MATVNSPAKQETVISSLSLTQGSGAQVVPSGKPPPDDSNDRVPLPEYPPQGDTGYKAGGDGYQHLEGASATSSIRALRRQQVETALARKEALEKANLEAERQEMLVCLLNACRLHEKHR